MDQLPRLGKRELICLLLFTCNYVVFVWRGFLFLWVLGMGYVILLWHSLSLPYNYFSIIQQEQMKKAEQFGVRAAKMSQEGQIVDGDDKVSLIDIKDGLVLVILCHPDLTRNAPKTIYILRMYLVQYMYFMIFFFV